MIFMKRLLFDKMLVVDLSLRYEGFKVCDRHLKLSLGLTSNVNFFISIVVHNKFVMVAGILIFLGAL